MGRNTTWAMRVAVLSALLAAVALFSAPRVVPARGSAGADDPALARALAERLLTLDHRWPVTLYPGSLPPGTPFEVPLPPGGRLLGSMVAPQPSAPAFPAGGELRIVLDAPGQPRGALNFYERALPMEGWSIVGRSRGQNPVRADEPAYGSFCKAGVVPMLDVVATAMFDGRAGVRLSARFGGAGPCDAPAPRNVIPPAERPNLSAEQEARARRLTLDDPRVSEILAGRGYGVGPIAAWHTAKDLRLIGAVVVLTLDEPLTLRYDWPIVAYDETEESFPPYEEGLMRITIRDATQIAIHVDLNQDRVVGIQVHKPVRH
jgi:hypothetical protein